MYKNQLTSILQLDAAAKKVFRGVYAIDRLPIRAQTSAAYVINMDNHDEPGSHWIAVFVINMAELSIWIRTVWHHSTNAVENFWVQTLLTIHYHYNDCSLVHVVSTVSTICYIVHVASPRKVYLNHYPVPIVTIL